MKSDDAGRQILQSMPSTDNYGQRVTERAIKSSFGKAIKNTEERQEVSEVKAASPMPSPEALPVLGVPP